MQPPDAVHHSSSWSFPLVTGDPFAPVTLPRHFDLQQQPYIMLHAFFPPTFRHIAYVLVVPWPRSAHTLTLMHIVVHLIGRWRSDEMLHYLHMQAYPLMHTFAQAMATGRSFCFLLGHYVPMSATPLLNLLPLESLTPPNGAFAPSHPVFFFGPMGS